MATLELKDFVNDKEFISKMNLAFADLRADYELSLDATKEKIKELKEVHVDIKNYLSDLSTLSVKSSGVISGLRGTGKTHLFLLARNNINNNIESNKTICIYLNVKRLHIPADFDQELFNRVFSIFLYNEISKQLFQLLNEVKENISLLDKILVVFKHDKIKLINNIGEAIKKIAIFKSIAKQGNEYLDSFSEGELSSEELHKSIIEIYSEIASKIGFNGAELKSKINFVLIFLNNKRKIQNKQRTQHIHNRMDFFESFLGH